MANRPIRKLPRSSSEHLRGIVNELDQADPAVRGRRFYRVDSGLDAYSGLHLSGGPLERFEDVAERMHRRLVQEGVLNPGEPLRVLDIGCGKGLFLKELKERLAERNIPADVHGVSLSPIEPDYAKRHGVIVHIQNAEQLPRTWSNRFHLVVSTGVFKHLSGGQRALVEAHRVLHPEGRAFLHLAHEDYHDLDWSQMALSHPEKQIQHEPSNVEFGKKNTRLNLVYR